VKNGYSYLPKQKAVTGSFTTKSMAKEQQKMQFSHPPKVKEEQKRSLVSHELISKLSISVRSITELEGKAKRWRSTTVYG